MYAIALSFQHQQNRIPLPRYARRPPLRCSLARVDELHPLLPSCPSVYGRVTYQHHRHWVTRNVHFPAGVCINHRSHLSSRNPPSCCSITPTLKGSLTELLLFARAFDSLDTLACNSTAIPSSFFVSTFAPSLPTLTFSLSLSHTHTHTHIHTCSLHLPRLHAPCRRLAATHFFSHTPSELTSAPSHPRPFFGVPSQVTAFSSMVLPWAFNPTSLISADIC
jgi:hypothetical protein